MILSWGDVAQWIAVGLLTGAMYLTSRNGKYKHYEQDGVSKTKVSNLEKMANTSAAKQDEILASVNDFKTHCAGISAGLDTRTKNLERIVFGRRRNDDVKWKQVDKD